MLAEKVAEEFLNVGVDLAIRSIADHDSFYPFALRLAPEGEVAMASAQIDGEVPSIEEVEEALWKDLANMPARDNLAVAVVIDIHLETDSAPGFKNAIQLEFEHHTGYTESFYVPYRKSDEGFEIGPLLSKDRDARVFFDDGE